MTTLLGPAPTPTRSVPQLAPGSRWRSTWRLSLRLARRDLARHKWRSILMVLLVALPVAAVGGTLTLVDMNQRAASPTARALRSLGSAPAVISVTKWQSAIRQNILGDETLTDDTATVRRKADDYTDQVRAVVGDVPLIPVISAEALLIGDDGVGQGPVDVLDVTQPAAAGRYDVVAGRLPAHPGEVAVVAEPHDSGWTPKVGEPIDVRVRQRDADGGRSYARRTATVVGLFTTQPGGQVAAALGAGDGDRLSTAAVTVPGWLTDGGSLIQSSWDLDQGVRQQLIVAADVPWSAVQAWNGSGLAVTSRAVLNDPPAGCPPYSLCPPSIPQASEREASSATDTASYREAAYTASALAVIGTLAVLQVALLAGPAFAVSLRSRQRELGLLAANGADRRTLSRQLVAVGLTVGVVGGVTGFLIGYGAAWGVTWAGGLTAVQPAVPPPWWTFVPVLLLAIVCALAAAWVPARVAGRTQVTGALSGRSHRPDRPLRMPLLGILLLLASAGLVAWGIANNDELAQIGAVLSAQLGLIALTPVLVAGLARAARWFPLSLRLAARDLNRNRLRTASAVAAVCAATAVGCAAVVVGPAAAPQSEQWGGQAATSGGFTIYAGADQAVAAAVHATFPGTTIVSPKALTRPWRTELRFVHDGVKSCRQSGRVDPCLPVRSSSETGGVLVMTPEQLRRVTGLSDPRIANVLAAGGAVAFSEHAVDESGRITIVTRGRGDQPDDSVSVPGLTFPDSPAAPAQVVVGPDFEAAALGAEVVPADVRYAITPTPPTRADLGRVRAAIARGEHPGQLWSVDLDEADSDPDAGDLTRIIVAGVTGLLALVTLVAALSVTALALADAKPDLATTAAVGAAPRFRRRFAAAAAWLMAGLGSALGAVAGLTAALTIAGSTIDGRPSVALSWWWRTPGDGRLDVDDGVANLPVGILLLLVLGIPLLCAAVAWLFTRSRIPMNRRLRD